MNCQFTWWTDHTYSDILGARITTNVECGSLLLTVLTLAVSLAEGAVWTIIAYTLFQFLASRHDVEAFRTQVQLILINPNGSFSDWYNLLSTGWNWRKHKPKVFFLSVALSLIPLLSFIGFTVAHIMVSRVTLPGYQANKFPASGGTCGLIQYHFDSVDGQLISQQHIINTTKVAQSYRRQCYHQHSDTISCDGFMVQELTYQTSYVECPWKDGSCLTTQALQLDTDWIDSHDHLGINAKPSDRVQARVVSTCSVINPSSYLNIVPHNSTNSFDTWRFYFDNPATATDPTDTYNGADITYYYAKVAGQSVDVAYTFYSTYYSWNASAGTAGVVPSLDRPDGSLTLLFVSANYLAYTAPNQDPLFYATTESADELGPGINVFTADSAVRVMGCLDQVSFRNPNTNQITPLQSPIAARGALWSIPSSIFNLGFNSAQNATANRIAKAFSVSAITHWNAAGLYTTGLEASSAVISGISPGLPNNQWALEVAGWFDTGLAKLQRTIVDYAQNSWTVYENAAQYISITDPSTLDSNGVYKDQCSNQLITGVALNQTFSALGVYIIIAIAPLLVLLAVVLSKIVRRFGTRHARNYDLAYRKMNVLRMALEGRGYDGWVGTDKNIPVRPGAGADIPPPSFEDERLDIPFLRAENGYLDDDFIESGSSPLKSEYEGRNVRTSVQQFNPTR